MYDKGHLHSRVIVSKMWLNFVNFFSHDKCNFICMKLVWYHEYLDSSLPSAAYMLCISETGQNWFRMLVACSVPSHYLSQCWDIIVNWTLRNILQWNFNQNIKFFLHKNAYENIVCEMAAILSRGRWVNSAVYSENVTICRRYWLKPPTDSWSPFQEPFLGHNWNLMEILVCSHPICNEGITIKFCTWHHSYGVVACAKFCSDITPCYGVTLKRHFHRIRIKTEMSFMKWASGSTSPLNAELIWRSKMTSDYWAPL